MPDMPFSNASNRHKFLKQAAVTVSVSAFALGFGRKAQRMAYVKATKRA